MNIDEIMDILYTLENKEKIIFKEKKFGIKSNNSLGIYHKDLQIIAKRTGMNMNLALALYSKNIYEARILCSKVFPFSDLSEDLMDQWVNDFENWEICDSFCMNLFSKSEFAVKKIKKWKSSKKEFVKRAAFTIIASYGFKNKNDPNEIFEEFLIYIYEECQDNRIYVKKAVNWALRNIGKRNKDLNKKAILTANKISLLNNKTSSWIASNALKELKNENLKFLDYPRYIYR